MVSILDSTWDVSIPWSSRKWLGNLRTKLTIQFGDVVKNLET